MKIKEIVEEHAKQIKEIEKYYLDKLEDKAIYRQDNTLYGYIKEINKTWADTPTFNIESHKRGTYQQRLTFNLEEIAKLINGEEIELITGTYIKLNKFSSKQLKKYKYINLQQKMEQKLKGVHRRMELANKYKNEYKHYIAWAKREQQQANKLRKEIKAIKNE